MSEFWLIPLILIGGSFIGLLLVGIISITLYHFQHKPKNEIYCI